MEKSNIVLKLFKQLISQHTINENLKSNLVYVTFNKGPGLNLQSITSLVIVRRYSICASLLKMPGNFYYIIVSNSLCIVCIYFRSYWNKENYLSKSISNAAIAVM